MVFDELKSKIEEILSRLKYNLYSFKIKNDYGISKIIEVTIDEQNISTDTLEIIHNTIRNELDTLIPEDYYFEVSSAGAERPIKNREELIKAIGKYIYLVSPQFKGNATLLNYENDILELKIKIKTNVKIIKIKYENASQMRYAVKV